MAEIQQTVVEGFPEASSGCRSAAGSDEVEKTCWAGHPPKQRENA